MGLPAALDGAIDDILGAFHGLDDHGGAVELLGLVQCGTLRDEEAETAVRLAAHTEDGDMLTGLTAKVHHGADLAVGVDTHLRAGILAGQVTGSHAAVPERDGPLFLVHGDGVATTINLPRLAIKSERNIDTFYRLLDDLLDLVRDQLYHRYQVQANLKVRDLPFLMGQGLYLDSDKLASDDRIEEAIKHGTLGVGFIGLAETLTSLLGCHHAQSEEAQKLGEDIIGHMREKVDAMSDKYDLNYSFIATPAEGLSGRFIRMDRKEYGIIPGVTDKAYYTNSFHVPVSYPISAFEKMRLEGAYHKFTNGGHISYVEFASSPAHNLGAVEDVLRHMLECDCGYVGINFPIDYCEECGYTGIIDSDYCPVCERTLTQKYCRETCCTE